MLFSLIIKLLEHQKVNDIRHVMVPLERERKRVREFLCSYVQSSSSCAINSVSKMLTSRRKSHWSSSLRLDPRKPALGSRVWEVQPHILFQQPLLILGPADPKEAVV